MNTTPNFSSTTLASALDTLLERSQQLSSGYQVSSSSNVTFGPFDIHHLIQDFGNRVNPVLRNMTDWANQYGTRQDYTPHLADQVPRGWTNLFYAYLIFGWELFDFDEQFVNATANQITSHLQTLQSKLGVNEDLGRVFTCWLVETPEGDNAGEMNSRYAWLWYGQVACSIWSSTAFSESLSTLDIFMTRVRNTWVEQLSDEDLTIYRALLHLLKYLIKSPDLSFFAYAISNIGLDRGLEPNPTVVSLFRHSHPIIFSTHATWSIDNLDELNLTLALNLHGYQKQKVNASGDQIEPSGLLTEIGDLVYPASERANFVRFLSQVIQQDGLASQWNSQQASTTTYVQLGGKVSSQPLQYLSYYAGNERYLIMVDWRFDDRDAQVFPAIRAALDSVISETAVVYLLLEGTMPPADQIATLEDDYVIPDDIPFNLPHAGKLRRILEWASPWDPEQFEPDDDYTDSQSSPNESILSDDN